MKRRLRFAPAFIAVMILSALQPLVAQSWLMTGNKAISTSKLGTLNSQPLRIFTNNVLRMQISSAGNVGIGTMTPAYKVHVVGNGLFTSGLNVSGGGISGSNNSGIGISGKGSTFGVFGNGNTIGVIGNGGLYGVSGSGSVYLAMVRTMAFTPWVDHMVFMARGSTMEVISMAVSIVPVPIRDLIGN